MRLRSAGAAPSSASGARAGRSAPRSTCRACWASPGGWQHLRFDRDRRPACDGRTGSWRRSTRTPARPAAGLDRRRTTTSACAALGGGAAGADAARDDRPAPSGLTAGHAWLRRLEAGRTRATAAARRPEERGGGRSGTRLSVLLVAPDESISRSAPMSSNEPPDGPKPALISSSSAVSNAGPKPCRPSPSSSPSSAARSSPSSRPTSSMPRGSGSGRLDLDRAVALEPGGRRDQLADDHVLLQAREAVDLALERRVGEHLRGLLEGGRRQERVRGQRGLGDAEDDLLERAPARRPPP